MMEQVVHAELDTRLDYIGTLLLAGSSWWQMHTLPVQNVGLTH